MARNEPIRPDSGSSPDIGKQCLSVAWLKLCGPLPGALTGATVGFQVYFRQPNLNTDTFAPLIFASLWAFCGLLIGMACSSFAAWLIERGLQRWVPSRPTITASLALLCVIGLCFLLRAPLMARLPELFWPALHNLPAHQQALPKTSAGQGEITATRMIWNWNVTQKIAVPEHGLLHV